MGMMARARWRSVAPVLLAAALTAACRGEPARAQRPADITRIVDSLRPAVERAAGLRFRSAPRSEMRTREQVRVYLERQLDVELPPAKVRGLETAYGLFGLFPDSLRLRDLLLELYSEQVAGYYDPDSAALFGVVGADPLQMRVMVAHEMVHALQGQYLPLDSLLHDRRSNDRLTAAQSILEGQATLVSLRVLTPGTDIIARPEFWEMYREQIAQQQSTMPVFAKAPPVIRHGLIFPYLEGAEFMRWWAASAHGDTVPYGPRMPLSTEQILHPERYERGDAPVALAFPDEPSVLYEDVLGEFETRVLSDEMTGRNTSGSATALGWGGDRYRVYETPDGPAMVWVSVWDDAASADRFLRGPGAALAARLRPGYRSEIAAMPVGGRPGVRFVIAPERWTRWAALPKATPAAG
jgi:hypothetical protein